MSAPVVLFYIQHLLGIGHLARASRIARALLDAGMKVTLVTGGLPVPGFPGPDIPHLALPPVAVADGGFKGLHDGNGQPASEDYLADRRDRLLAAFHRIRPDIVITEAFPFGRRQMRFELIPLLAAIKAARPRPMLAASVRDILQKRGRPDRDQETVDQVRRHFDLVLMHGDPGFAALGDSFPFADRIADKVVYTGLVCPPPPAPASERFDIVVSAGGGAVGRDLVRAAVAAAALMPDLARWCILTGPNLPQAEYDDIAGHISGNVTLDRFRRDLASLMSGARLSVSQAGYNTVGDILQAGCRALLVPYTDRGETEQADRAALLQRAGRVTVCKAEGMTPDSLATAIRQALAAPMPGTALPVKTDGAAETARILADHLSRRR
ncbi:MAG: glycosyl transferase [Rhodobacterales bacterium 32-66-7]|nr:MAG: glycosyl transferase [Rhodobacterales bacterium 12-65-15]OYX25295.1 MAG: glycosyl transferase [Rhodobacterales bacterium 32-66-7]